MHLSEVIFQGVGNKTGTTKLTLNQGMNFVKPANAESGETAFEVIVSLLFERSAKISELIQIGSEQIRGGITLSNLSESIRLVRDFKADAVSVSQFKAEQNDFAELSRDKQFVRDLLSSRFLLPSQGSYRQLFCMGGNALTQILQDFRKAHGYISKGQEYFEVLEKEEDSGDKGAKLKELRKQLASMEKLQQLEMEMDELEQSAFEKEEQLNTIKQREEMLASKELEVKEVISVDSDVPIPTDIVQKIEKYRKSEEKRDADLKRLEGKADKLTREASRFTIDPIHKNHFFLGGMSAVLVAAGLLFANLKFLFVILLTLGIAAIGFAFFQQVSKQDRQRQMKEELNQLTNNKKSIEKKYEIEMASVTHLMKRLSLRNPDEILELVKDREVAMQSIEEERENLKKFRNQVNENQLRSELIEIKKKSDSIKQRMTQFTGSNYDPMSLRREIDAIEAELGISSNDSSGAWSGGDSNGYDPFDDLLASCSRLLNVAKDSLTTSVEKGLATNLVAFSGRLLAAPIYQDGRITAFSTGAGGTKISIADLDEKQLAHAYLALQFTISQVLIKNRQPLPVFLLELPETLRPSAAVIHKAFTFLSKSTQVIHISNDALFASIAKPTVEF